MSRRKQHSVTFFLSFLLGNDGVENGGEAMAEREQTTTRMARTSTRMTKITT